MDLPLHPVQYGEIYYNPDKQAFIEGGNKHLKLRPKTRSVFLFLIQNNGRVVSKTAILDAVWGHQAITHDSLVQCVKEIRQVLADKERKILQTIPRQGYLLRSLNAEKPALDNSLPEELLPLLGRNQEISDLHSMLADPSCRLICLSGLGGVGKSRLAKAVGKQAAPLFQDGVFFVPLAAVQTSKLVPGAIAKTLGLTTQGNRSVAEFLRQELRQRQALLIFDNMEHLQSATKYCQSLLEHCSHLKLLVTSRVALNTYGSWNYPLHGLPVPDNTDAIDSNAAYKLFIQSAKRANYTFQTDNHDIPHIIDICHLVGGMPLGIEVAAAWTQHLSCAEILSEMHNYLLPGFPAEASNTLQPPSLNTVLQHSWQMLNPRERKIMQTLGLFRGKFSREAACAIAGATHDDFITLINKSILNRDSEGYFVLHEVMRQYANEQAQQHCENQANRQRFIDYHLQRAAQADEDILGGQQFSWLLSLEQEHANFRESLTLCLDTPATTTTSQQVGLQLSGSLGWFWFLANHWREGRNWAEQFLDKAIDTNPSSSRSQALLTAGGLATLMDDYTVAYQHLSTGIKAAREVDHPGILSRGLAVMSVLRRLQGEFSEAITLGQESMTLFRQQQDWGGYMLSLGWLGQSLIGKGHFQQALPVFEECLQLNHKVGTTISLPHALVNLGYVQWKLEQPVVARAYLEKAIATSEQCGTLLYLAQALCFYGWLELTTGDKTKAQACFQDSARYYLQLGDNTGLAEVLEGMAALAAKQDNYARAGQLLGSAGGVRSKLVAAPHPENEKQAKQVFKEVEKHLSPEEIKLQRNLGLACGVEELLSIN